MEPQIALALIAAVATLALLLGQRRPGEAVRAPRVAPPPPEVAPALVPEGPPDGELAARLASADGEAWVERRRAVWKLRRRWFAEPAYRHAMIERLCPGGGAAPAPPPGKAGELWRWLTFLADSTPAADRPELRPRLAALYAPWRGFAIDLTRQVERRRAALPEVERRQLPAPLWLEPLQKLDGRLFPDTPYDFLEQPLDRALVELDGARRKVPEAGAAPDQGA